MRREFLLSAAAMMMAAAVSCTENKTPDTTEVFTSYVNTKIGSGGHGHVFVGADVPFGMVQVGPNSIPQTWDWCSGYHVSDSTVIGFSHTHLSGTGCQDLGDVLVMPVVGSVKYARGTEDDPQSGLWSYADRSKEMSSPGYYSVPLVRYGVTAEMTATCRVGIHRLTFPQSDSSAVVFDLENGQGDISTDTGFNVVDSVTVSGWRFSKGWAPNQKVFFYARFSKPFTADIDSTSRYGRFNFKTSEGEKVLLKVALSPVSTEGAAANMEEELPGWDFDKTAAEADAAWNKELSKIKIDTDDPDKRTIFYTALYHSMIHPAIYNDVDGRYRGSDDQIHKGTGVNYTVFSLWDTYRALMPLASIIHPEKMDDIVISMLNIYKEQGKLPIWHLASNETNCMVGSPGVIVVSDAIVKGFTGFDTDQAYEAAKNSMEVSDRGLDIRRRYGYLPADIFTNESVAYDMEYAIADGALAHAAEALGKTEDAKRFTESSHSYRHYFDPQTMFMRGRNSNGKFITPFNPYYSNHRNDVYCEGNAWQYTWLVPQDFDGLVSLYGSKEKLVERLDTLFAASSHIDGAEASSDISGLIGQYVHGNEPSHHIIYFYTMAGQPWKAADKIREVLSTMYFNDVNGLAGNEDEGQMSAWYILSSLGFYQVEPASTRYWFGTPAFKKAEVKVSGGKFTVTAENLSDENKYIQSVELNGRPYLSPFIDYKDIYKGGTLTFKMGSEPKALE